LAGGFSSRFAPERLRRQSHYQQSQGVKVFGEIIVYVATDCVFAIRSRSWLQLATRVRLLLEYSFYYGSWSVVKSVQCMSAFEAIANDMIPPYS
jgi:hypothetical protein